MQKLTTLFIILLFVSCYKTDNKTEILQDTASETSASGYAHKSGSVEII